MILRLMDHGFREGEYYISFEAGDAGYAHLDRWLEVNCDGKYRVFERLVNSFVIVYFESKVDFDVAYLRYL